jgi:hypothetical protein
MIAASISSLGAGIELSVSMDDQRLKYALWNPHFERVHDKNCLGLPIMADMGQYNNNTYSLTIY